MISDKMTAALNEQVNREVFSAYLYMSMSAHCNQVGLKGFANWMYVQGLEELTHAKRIYDYILHRGGEIRLKAVEAPSLLQDEKIDAFFYTVGHPNGNIKEATSGRIKVIIIPVTGPGADTLL